ncbi:MAG: hypothetical protein J6Q49_04670 [Kiritimatiellae bacterium]|nr:hypothetical protein [Kiritimatiellia bacterium]
MLGFFLRIKKANSIADSKIKHTATDVIAIGGARSAAQITTAPTANPVSVLLRTGFI